MKTDTTSNETPCSWKWWFIWAVSFLVSLLPPIVFHWRNVSGIIEPLRFAGMLLPADLLTFRWLGELTHWVPAILLGLAFLAKRNPARARAMICSSAFLTGFFSAVYAAYSVLIASVDIEGQKRGQSTFYDKRIACSNRQENAGTEC